MPAFRHKIRCAYADPIPKKPRAPRPTLTPEEKALKKLESEARKEKKQLVTEWESKLQVWKDSNETFRHPLNTEVSIEGAHLASRLSR